MKTNYLTLLSSSLLATGIVLSSSVTKANAFTLTETPKCDVATAVFNPNYDACKGAYLLGMGENDVTDGDADNIVNQLLNDEPYEIFGAADWTFGAKIDDDGTEGLDGLFTLDGLNQTTGKITLDETKVESILGGEFEDYEIAISFKAAKNFSIYKWDAPLGGTNPTNTITWSTAGTATNDKGKVQGLSHASVYVRKVDGGNGNPTDIPEPGTMLGLGLFALGTAATARKKK